MLSKILAVACNSSLGFKKSKEVVLLNKKLPTTQLLAAVFSTPGPLLLQENGRLRIPHY